MPDKLTYEFVKNSFEKSGYILFSEEYINNHTKLEYQCPNGHIHNIVWRNWQRGDRCPYCDGQGKPTTDEIKTSFESEGYTLLSNEYINNKSKLEYICPNGHKHKMTWSDWKNKGVRCLYCSNRSPVNIDNIKEKFAVEGYTLLCDEYQNNCTKLDYICSLGHKHNITWANWQSGYRCPTCAYLNSVGDKHWNWQGGKSFEGYCPIWKDKEFKLDILERDAYNCLNPYCYKNDTVLSVHHIDYDKNNCHPSNLITVCRACNSRANYDRVWHIGWYRAIMYKRYGHVYE